MQKGFSTLQKLSITIITLGAVGGLIFFTTAFGGTKFASTLSLASATSGLDNGLLAHYTFDGKDMPSGQVNDTSGNGNHGSQTSMASSTAYVDGAIGQGLRTDGVNDYVNFPVSVATAAAADDVYSWSTWVKVASTGPSQIIMTATDVDGRGDGNTIFEFNIDGTASNFNASAAANNSGLVASSIVFNKWTFLAAVKNGSQLDFYVDGVLAGTDTTVNSAAALTPTVFRIGRPSSSTRFYGGSVDDVRVYTNALTADQVKQLYQLGATTHISSTPSPSPRVGGLDYGLVGHYTFDGKDMPSGQVNDTSGSGYNGSQVNMSTSSAFVQGVIGQALRFDGTDDYIYLANHPSSLGSQFSISMWAKAGNGGVSNRHVIDFRGSGSAVLALRFGAGDAFFRDASGITPTGGQPLLSVATGTWAFYAAIADGTNVKTYKNGVLLSTLPWGRTLDTSSTWYIARANSGLQYEGALDDIRVYSRTLTEDEIRQLYQLGATTHISSTPSPSPRVGGLDYGLVGHYTFDGKDMPSGQVNDTSGNGNHGSMINMSTSTSRAFGVIGQALRFDGSSDHVDFPSQTFSGPFTASLWWKENTSDGTFHMALTKTPAGTVEKFGVNSNNTNFFVRVLTSGSADSSIALPSKNQWHHVVLRRNSADKIDLIVDAGSANRLFSDIAQTGDSIWGTIGGLSAQRFAGLIDDVRLYNRALSTDEIKQLYQMGQ